MKKKKTQNTREEVLMKGENSCVYDSAVEFDIVSITAALTVD